MLTAAQQLLARRPPAEDDRLLRLFWNRVELKQEFARLQRDRERMLDVLRQQEGALLRAQQRLEQLEGLLADPERAVTACVYFQLRGIWSYGRRRLTRLARDLAARQLAVETQRELARFEEHRQVALAAIVQRLAPLEERRTLLETERSAVRTRLLEATGSWNYFLRRRLNGELEALQAAQTGIEEQIERYQRARHEKLREKLAPGEELSVEGKRLVNLSVIALAQELVLLLMEHNVAARARDASLRQVSEVNYGDPKACRDLSQRIGQVLRRAEAAHDLPGRVELRSEYLRQQLEYRRDTDTVPIAEGLARIVASLPGEGRRSGKVAGIAVNVLLDEYWEIYAVLLH